MRDQEIVDLQEAYASIYASQEELTEEVEIAAQYFYEMGLNEEGVEILIEELGVEEFSEWVYDIADDYYLTERKLATGETALPARSRGRIGGRSAASRRFSDPTKKGTAGNKRRVARAAARAESESQETPRQERIRELRARAADEATKKQPKKQGLLDRVAGAVNRGLDAAKNKAQKDIETRKKFMSNVRGTVEVAKKAAGKVGGVAKEVGKGASGAVKFAAAVTREEVEAWVNNLLEEGYDLSEYTWDDMYEIYIDEERRDPRGRVASGPMNVYGGRGTPSPDPEGDDNVSRMDRAQRRVKRTQPRAKGMAADALNTKYSARQTGRGGVNPSPSDRTAKGHPHSPRRSGRRGLGAETDRGGGNAASRRAGREPGSFREEYDLFDTILEHLVAEGFADTNEAALVIMANMSEEWRQSIVEGEGSVDINKLGKLRLEIDRMSPRELRARYGNAGVPTGSRLTSLVKGA